MSKQHNPRFVALCEAAKKHISELSASETKALLDADDHFFLVDVREESEWQKGHARGAVHLGKGVIERDIERAIPNPDATIVLYCGGGFRSALAAQSVALMGYTNVYSMAGGWRAWLSIDGPMS